MNLSSILSSLKKFSSGENVNSDYGNIALPLAAIIEAGVGRGAPTVAGSQMEMLAGLPQRKEEYRQAALERKLGINKAESANKFREEAAAGGDLGSLYAKHNPEEAGKSAYDSALKLKEIMASPQRMTDFQRKFAAVKDAHPDWDDQKILDYTLVPSSQVGPSQEKIEGQKSLSEAGALGANTPTAGAAKADVAKTVAKAEIAPKIALKQAESDIAVEEAARKAKQEFQIIKDQPKKQIDFVMSLGRKVVPQGRSLGAVASTAGAAMGTNPELKAYDQLFNTMISNMARSYGGEKGVLTDYDIKRMAGFKFSPYDTPEERSYKEKYLTVLTGLTAEQEEALRWANSPENKKDPRAAEIKKQIGIDF